MGMKSSTERFIVKGALRTLFGVAVGVLVLNQFGADLRFTTTGWGSLANGFDALSQAPHYLYASVASLVGGFALTEMTLDLYRHIRRPVRLVGEIANTVLNAAIWLPSGLAGAVLGTAAAKHIPGATTNFHNWDLVMHETTLKYGWDHFTFESAVKGVATITAQMWSTITKGLASGSRAVDALPSSGNSVADRAVDTLYSVQAFATESNVLAAAFTAATVGFFVWAAHNTTRWLARAPIRAANWQAGYGYVDKTGKDRERNLPGPDRGYNPALGF